MYKAGYSGAEIAAKFECSLETVSSVIEIATRKSQIVQRIASMSISNAVDEPREDSESPVVETPPIPLEALVRNFWTDKTRAVDVLLLPHDLRSKITESVEQALLYVWNTLGSVNIWDYNKLKISYNLGVKNDEKQKLLHGANPASITG